MRRGNCIQTNKMTGTLARKMIGYVIHGLSRSMMNRAEEKATIMVAMEMKSVERSIIIFVGKDLRKSSLT
ncbi:hypothetical protein D8674_018225 [Pyrus ussuriensis x Pyrus communis]|uniref:Uncharacterized protein n=1 Tax=Pyrus ussuriensis x Pyrus communis TaxID=2448454 RepID=A0A5N5G4C6_9ROSA|nr:hypothetical protein D8674_018225 [Pyrus ussuriensis x Pyrus communis]